MIKLKEKFNFAGSLRESYVRDITIYNRVLSFLFLIVFSLTYSQEKTVISANESFSAKSTKVIISNASQIHIMGDAFVYVNDIVMVSSKKQIAKRKVSIKKEVSQKTLNTFSDKSSKVIISNASQIHVVGDAFVYVNDIVLVSSKKQITKRKVSIKKEVARKTLYSNSSDRIAKKTYVQKKPLIVPKFNSAEEEMSFLSANDVIAKLAVCPYFDIMIKDLYQTMSRKKNFELLYQKKIYFYNSNIGVLNFSKAFFVRPPPVLV